MTAYYNENDPYAAQWLRNLIVAGHIAPGVVDERSIVDVEAFELANFAQCHFFAGIGAWSLALRRAGFEDDFELWTGSCPCQPFSAAGKQKGFDDERHLWPAWFRLVAECRPSILVGEQVDKALAWLDLVSADLEREGYAFGSAILCAAGFGGAHARHRNYFVALGDTGGTRAGRNPGTASCLEAGGSGARIDNGGRGSNTFVPPIAIGSLALADRRECDGRTIPAEGNDIDRQDTGWSQGDSSSARRGRNGRMADDARSQGRDQRGDSARERIARPTHAPLLGRTLVDWLYCRDGKWRPVEPGVQQVVDETAVLVGRMRPDHEAQVEEIVNETALRFSTTRDEILRAVRRGLAAANVRQRSARRAFCTSEAQVLLTALRELDREEGEQPNAENGAGALGCVEAELRMLWRDRAPGDPPRQRELARQLAVEFADALRALPPAMARAAQEAGYPVLYADAPASFPLSDGGPDARKNRVGKLRAYGNALDVETATEFCAAVREIVAGV